MELDGRADGERVRGRGGRSGDTLSICSGYAETLYKDDDATLDDLREAVSTLEDVERIARRVFGSTHPHLQIIEHHLRASRAALRAREMPPAKA